MGSGRFHDVERAGFTGKVRADLDLVFDEVRLSGFTEELKGGTAKVLAEGRHRVVVVPLQVDGKEILAAVKSFGKQSSWKDRYDRKRGSKAARSFQAAEFLASHGVGTPEPLGYFNRWEGRQLVESYYLSEYVTGLTSFKDELIAIYRQRPECDRLVSLLEHIARSIRKMHDAGFCHRDLGNQNMELKESSGDEWGEVQFIDLNRGRIRESLTMQDRAQDFSRIRLPSAFLEILMRMYWGGMPPTEFARAVRKIRGRFDFWMQTHKWRHPFGRRSVASPVSYPEVQDIWIWDQQSAQAAVTMTRRERKKVYPGGKYRKVAASILKSGVGVWKEYQHLMPQAFTERVELTNKVGMALESSQMDFERQREFLKSLGKIPVLLRFCHHEDEAQWEETAKHVERLHDEGHEVMIAILQSRQAVLNPPSWRRFLEYVLERVAGKVVMVELCHAVNRMKWGVHSSKEQRVLLEPIVELQKKYPEMRFSGPACIDFEYHYVQAALDETPEGLHYSALSHHLYVDRRGAPENFQGKFSTVEKCGLLRAIANRSSRCDDQVIVSEVNWPVKGAGIWSPVDATYITPGVPENPLNVSEEDYGHFMLRYLVLSLCSGFVDRVYWWRLVAHGFGLVDEQGEGGWRARPGFKMLENFLQLLGASTFIEKIEVAENVYAFRFERTDDEVTMLWCHDREYDGPWSFEFKEVLDVFGEKTTLGTVGGAPVYGIS